LKSPSGDKKAGVHREFTVAEGITIESSRAVLLEALLVAGAQLQQSDSLN
jgi:hypothetical protein